MPTIRKTSSIAHGPDGEITKIGDAITVPDPSIPIEVCDQALGAFLRAWEQMEYALSSAVAKLLGVDDLRAAILLEDVGQSDIRNILMHIGSYYLRPEDQKQLNILLSDIQILAGVRNKLVHGKWSILIKKREETGEVISADFSRNVFIADANALHELFDPKSQKAPHIRSKNYFTPEQVIEEANKIRPIADRLNRLISTLDVRRDHPRSTISQRQQAARKRNERFGR